MKTRKQLSSLTQKFGLSMHYFVPQTSMDAVVEKVLVCAGTNYKGLGGVNGIDAFHNPGLVLGRQPFRSPPPVALQSHLALGP